MNTSAANSEVAVEDEREHFTIIPEWVLDAEISDRAVRLYGVLGRYGNGTGQRLVSRQTLADRCRCSVDTIDRAVKELEGITAIRIERRFEVEEGRKTNYPNRYILTLGGSRTTAATQPHTRGQGGRTDAARGGRTDAALQREISTERDLQREETPLPPGTNEVVAARVAAYDVADAFTLFWQAYPRKVGKPAANTAYRRAERAADRPQDIFDGLKRWITYWRADETEPRLIPHPTTWLNQHRWNDDPPPLRRQTRSRRDEQMDGIDALVGALPTGLFDGEPLVGIAGGPPPPGRLTGGSGS